MRFLHNVAVLTVLLLAACGSPPATAPSDSTRPVSSTDPSAVVGPIGSVNVTLGLYSGRADPQWTLTTEEAATLDAMLARLPDSTGTPPVGGLGYHGFTIQLPGSTLIAYRGVVASPDDGPRTVKEDPTRSVERYLLETSASRVTAVEQAETTRALTEP